MESDIQDVITTEKVLEKFYDLPKSLSKTIETKIKNGKIIDYLASWASGELNNASVLKTVEKLGFDGYFKNDGEAIVRNSSLLDYGERGKENHGREGIRDKEEGKQRISTKEIRRGLVERVKAEASYTERALGGISKFLQEKGKDGRIKIIDEKAYTPDMSAISNKMKDKWGIREPMSFVISDGALQDDIEGFHTKDGIYIVLDNIDGDVGNVAMHEAWHALEESGDHDQTCAETSDRLMELINELDFVANEKSFSEIEYGRDYGRYYAMLYKEFSMLHKEYGDDYKSIFSELAGDFLSGRISEDGGFMSAAPADEQDFINKWWKKVESEASKEKPSYYLDTEGNKLSESQKKFFSKSKVRDRSDKSKLRVVYNATDVDFNTFDYSSIGKGAGALYGPGFYFSFDDLGDHYGVSGSRRFYLNIVNPAKDDAITFTDDDIESVISGMDSLYDGKNSDPLWQRAAR